jgi:hypothetical protein
MVKGFWAVELVAFASRNSYASCVLCLPVFVRKHGPSIQGIAVSSSLSITVDGE